MESATFTHTVSKGSRYKQIYIPRSAEQHFEAGDIVEVRLLKKKFSLHYSPSRPQLSEFKENLVQIIFETLSKNKKIEQTFIFGSFLTRERDYQDVDILIFSEEDIEAEAYHALENKIDMKFHILVAKKELFLEELKISPLLRSMLSTFISSSSFSLPVETHIDEKYLRYLLMMPKDLLKVKLDEGRVYYDSLRKLLVIEYFLKDKELSPALLEEKICTLLDKEKVALLRENRYVPDAFLSEIRTIIKKKLSTIEKLLKNGEKR